MRILHYIPTYAPSWKFGGPVLSVSQLCEELAMQGHEVEVLTTVAGIGREEGILAGRQVERNGVKVTYFSCVPGMGIKSPDMEAAVAARAAWAQVIHVTGVWQRVSRAARVAALAAGTPYVVSPRGALGIYSWGQKRLKKTLYFLLAERENMRRAAGVHYTSEMERAECARFGFPGLARIIANGIDTSLWRRDEAAGAAWRVKSGLAADGTLILSACRLHHKKGLDLLPGALARMTNRDWTMVFLGGDDDGTRGRLQAEFAGLGLTDKVLFMDRVSPQELRAAYSAADLFVLPSRHENFGNAVLEAMVCGCPVLVSDQVGFGSEAISTGLAQILRRDAAVWAGELDAAMRDPLSLEKRRKLALAAAERYDIRSTAGEMARFYAEVAQAGRSGI